MNNSNEAFSFSGRIRSGVYALQGITVLLKSQHNAWIHAVATLCVVGAGVLLGVSRLEWCLLVLAITLVWLAEALNTALEFLCDAVSPEFHPLVKKSKDIAAGAVLLSAVGAAAMGLIIFTPYLVA
jgi:diacylglycerol kinase (ATP)